MTITNHQEKILTRKELYERFCIPLNNKLILDIGCGSRKFEGSIGLDSRNLSGVDIVTDISKKLPFLNNTLDEIRANFVFEHSDNFIFLMEEIYRILTPIGRVECRVPYWSSDSQWKDPTHHQVITEETFRYFSDDKWYGSDYGFNANYKILHIHYNYYSGWWRYCPFRDWARKHLINIVHSMDISLLAVK